MEMYFTSFNTKAIKRETKMLRHIVSDDRKIDELNPQPVIVHIFRIEY